MFTFEILTDATLANEAFHSPNNIRWAHDDNYKGSFKIPYNHDWLFLGCYINGEFVGCIMGLPGGPADISLHIAFLPNAYGQTEALVKAFLAWLKYNMPEYRRYWASIVPYNALVKRLLGKTGFTYHHHDKGGWLKDGITHGKDVHFYQV